MKLGDGDRPKVQRAWVPNEPGPVPARDQLLAIASSVHDPTIDDGEWSARIKDRIAKLSLSPASLDAITMAIRLLSKRLPRPDPFPPRLREESERNPPGLSREDARSWYTRLLADFTRRRAGQE